MEQGTCSSWLEYLDDLNVVDEAWVDPVFVRGVSWIMLMFIWRRMNQRLIDAGFATDSIPSINT